ncbi:hypothetical protein DIS18_00300 [Algibacter marinivivus]|uniref:DinB family protein n=1 Tax=Algibacter marinivivus TaxID=2100723 RepID=A0A2U2X5K4_9FLAO|nr:hypothetical protein [Algibacter marinivivus]PWH83032.1 hypothetical protein DIS18_00300 [Algibacter marinivivus]
MKKSILLLALILTALAMAQSEEKLPYYQIPDYSETYTQGTVAARMVDGLGFRYYWATEGLRPEDLNYKPSESGRTSSETVDHLFGLSNFILSSISKDFEAIKNPKMTFEEKRKQTLLNFKTASDILTATEDLSKFDNDKYPFWNVINGPISDALWHCGQVVMLRRASGNPFNSKVSVFRGKLRD